MIRLWQVTRQGNALINAQAFSDGVTYLAQELMQEPEPAGICVGDTSRQIPAAQRF